MTQSQVSHVRRHHRHRQESRLSKLIHEMPELVWLAVALLGVLLLTVWPQFRHLLARGTQQVAATAMPAGRALSERLWNAALGVSPAQMAGFLLVLLGLGAVLYRVRWRMMRMPSLVNLQCPRCSGEIHRVHRHTVDRIGSVFVPLRRYRCFNTSCGWEGVRVAQSGPRPAPRRR